MPTIKIGPHKIPVNFYTDPHVDEQPVFGFYADFPQEIGLDRELKDKPTQLTATVLHEALEAINVIYSANLDHDQITLLGSTLAALLIENRFVRSVLPD